jgi:predicted DNA-binding transcriptional regulator AlpA
MFFSVPDLMSRWGCSRAHIYNEIAKRRLPRPMKLGRKSLFPRSEIEAAEARLLASRGEPPKPLSP